MNRTATGIAYVVASALCFGAMPVFARRASASGVDTQTLLLVRFAIASLVMWVVFLWRRVQLPRGRALGLLVGMGALGYSGQAFCFFTALQHASAGLVTLLLYLYPVLVALISWAVFRQPLGRVQLAAVGLALVGSILTIGRAGDGEPLGIALGLAAALVYSVYIHVGARLPKAVSATASTTVILTSAALVYGLVALQRGVRLPADAGGWLALVALAIVGAVLAISFFLAGLERLGPVRASVYSASEPAFTLALAALLLGEEVTLLRLAGGALILGAVLLLARQDVARG